MQMYPLPCSIEAIDSLFRKICFTTGVTYKVAAIPALLRNGLLRIIGVGKEMVNTNNVHSDSVYNGWIIQSKDMGSDGYSYLNRAALNLQSIGAFLWEEATYLAGYHDINGKESDGPKSNYTLHFNKEELPQVLQR